MKKTMKVTIVALLASAAALTSLADTFYWQGDTDSGWQNTYNWSMDEANTNEATSTPDLIDIVYWSPTAALGLSLNDNREVAAFIADTTITASIHAYTSGGVYAHTERYAVRRSGQCGGLQHVR